MISWRGRCVVAKDCKRLLEEKDFIVVSNKFIQDSINQRLTLLRDLEVNGYTKVTDINDQYINKESFDKHDMQHDQCLNLLKSNDIISDF